MGQIVVNLEQIAHFLAGFLSALACLVNIGLSVIGFAGFEIYEVWEYWERIDWPTTETLVFMTGFFSGVVVLLFASAL